MNQKPKEAIKIEVRKLNKAFDGITVLTDVNLKVLPGKTVAIMGPSGTGKSVLLRHIAGLEIPDSGEVLVNDQPMNLEAKRDDLRLAMVFQSGALFNSLTVEENLSLWLEENRPELSPDEIARLVQTRLDQVHLPDSGSKFPSELSGGMRKRVSIARALVSEPNLILYDEPTSELDPLMSKSIGELIEEVQEQIQQTSIVVTHDRELAFAIADYIAVMLEGKIVEFGTPSEIQASSNPEVQYFLKARMTRKGAAV